MGFPTGSVGKESACNVENLGSVPGLGRSPGEGDPFQPGESHGLYPLQPGEFHGLYCPWGCEEGDTTE